MVFNFAVYISSRIDRQQSGRMEVKAFNSPMELETLCQEENIRLPDYVRKDFLLKTLKLLGISECQNAIKTLINAGHLKWKDDAFEVEVIINVCTAKETGELWYLVKWKGWSSVHNTWEPRSNLIGCEDKIEEFENAKKRSYTPIKRNDQYEEIVHQLTTKSVNEVTSSMLIAAAGKSNDMKRKKKISRSIKINRSKKAQLMKAELQRWQDELNKICNDPAGITVENNVDHEGPPQDFTYINEYLFANADRDKSFDLVGCACAVCKRSKKTCCAHMANSRYAYTTAKRITLPPGHPIYECNSKCSCGPECTNRLIQNGRYYPLAIFRTKFKGWGLKTMKAIPKGAFVLEYVGEVLSCEEAAERDHNDLDSGMTYLFDLDFDLREPLYTVDGRNYGNASHFINHSCDPNLQVYAAWIDNQNPALPRLAFFAKRRICKEEELTFDYGGFVNRSMNLSSILPESEEPESSQSDNSSGYHSIGESELMRKCLCGAKNCRQILFS